MEIRTLSNFIVVAEEKNVRRAALRLHITQPALTRQIQSLEEDFGAPLFVRNAHGLEMTPAGDSLLQHAINIRVEFELARRDAIRIASDRHQKFNIGVYGSAIFSTIPQILNMFSRQHPGVEMVLHSARKEQQIQSLRHGQILIAFDRFLEEEPDLVCEVVHTEPLMLALHISHPLAQCPTIDVGQLRGETFIGASDAKFDGAMLHFLGFMPRIEHRVDDLMTSLAMVGCGYGMSFGPPSIQALRIPNVVFRPFQDGVGIALPLHCLYRKHENSPQLQLLLDVVRTYRAENCG